MYNYESKTCSVLGGRSVHKSGTYSPYCTKLYDYQRFHLYSFKLQKLIRTQIKFIQIYFINVARVVAQFKDHEDLTQFSFVYLAGIQIINNIINYKSLARLLFYFKIEREFNRTSQDTNLRQPCSTYKLYNNLLKIGKIYSALSN